MDRLQPNYIFKFVLMGASPLIPILVPLLSFKGSLKNSTIRQIIFVPSSKCRKTNAKLGLGAVIDFALQLNKLVI